jgi:hypothetical protein
MPKIIGTKPQRQESVDLERIIMESTETKPEEATAEEKPAELTIESIEEYLIDQGNFLEVQIKSEPHKLCPVCAATKAFMEELCRMIADTLRGIEESRRLSEGAEFPDPEGDRLTELHHLKRELQWYELSKVAMSHLVQAGHATRDVMSAHPELVVSKAQKRKIRSGKHKKQISKESRRKNRH